MKSNLRIINDKLPEYLAMQNVTFTYKNNSGIIPDKTQELLFSYANSVDYPANETLFKRGDIGTNMYFIERGSVEVTFMLGYKGKVLEAGEYFGEIALLTGYSKRTATVITRTACKLKLISQQDLERLSQQHSQILCDLLRKTCAYLVDDEHALVTKLQQQNQELEQSLDYLMRTRSQLDISELYAITDDLTNLYNHRFFKKQLQECYQKPIEQRQFSLLLIELQDHDQLKAAYGIQGLEVALQCLAQLVKEQAKRHDLPCRLSDHKFAMLCRSKSDDSLQQRAETLQENVHAFMVHLSNMQFNLKIKQVGVIYKTDMVDEQALIQIAQDGLDTIDTGDILIYD